tara:strand:+ start:3387 stop:3638 length:252 start_codon:yes stop_codon:yes gene_type:complete
MEKQSVSGSSEILSHYKEYHVGDLVQSVVVGLQDFEYNSFGRLGIVVDVIEHKLAARVWWVGEDSPKTVLYHTFKLISRGKKK